MVERSVITAVSPTNFPRINSHESSTFLCEPKNWKPRRTWVSWGENFFNAKKILLGFTSKILPLASWPLGEEWKKESGFFRNSFTSGSEIIFAKLVEGHRIAVWRRSGVAKKTKVSAETRLAGSEAPSDRKKLKRNIAAMQANASKRKKIFFIKKNHWGMGKIVVRLHSDKATHTMNWVKEDTILQSYVFRCSQKIFASIASLPTECRQPITPFV